MGRRLADYLALYTRAVTLQGRIGWEALLERAGIPPGSVPPYSLSGLGPWLRSLVMRTEGFGVDYLEQLLAVNQLVADHVNRTGVRPDAETQHWAGLCHQAAFMLLVVCVNQHFGVMPESGVGAPRAGKSG
jgi:hypothetical protein